MGEVASHEAERDVQRPAAGLPVSREAMHEMLAVICPTCDEAHFARLARHCAWCGWDFGSGEAFGQSEIVVNPLPNRRVLGVIFSVVSVCGGVIAYFAWLVNR